MGRNTEGTAARVAVGTYMSIEQQTNTGAMRIDLKPQGYATQRRTNLFASNASTLPKVEDLVWTFPRERPPAPVADRVPQALWEKAFDEVYECTAGDHEKVKQMATSLKAGFGAPRPLGIVVHVAT